MPVDRKKGPLIHPIREISLPQVDKLTLDNDVPAYFIKGGTDHIIKLELVFKGGRSMEMQKLASKTCAFLMTEGAGQRNSEELAEQIDFFGSTISSNSGLDLSTLSVYCLKKYAKQNLQLLSEILYEPLMPQSELDKYGRRTAEKLKIHLSKNEVVAYREITKQVYGKDHVYGYNSDIEDYLQLDYQNAYDHYKRCYHVNNMFVLGAGAIDDEFIKQINYFFGSKNNSKQKPKHQYTTPHNVNAFHTRIKGTDTQSSLKMSALLFNRKHVDYPKVFLLNVIFGGYFGSRLNHIIREEKGYTYSIYSDIDVTNFDGTFNIVTEVSNENLQLTIDEIISQMRILQKELISTSEITMAKNYIMGNFLSMVDGPFKSSAVFKMIVKNGFDENYLSEFTSQLLNTSPQELQQLALKYLNFEDFHIVSVGK